MAMSIYGKLPKQKRVLLSIVENHRDWSTLLAEYRDVFPDIQFIWVHTTKKQLAEARAKAFANLFKSLNLTAV